MVEQGKQVVKQGKGDNIKWLGIHPYTSANRGLQGLGRGKEPAPTGSYAPTGYGIFFFFFFEEKHVMQAHCTTFK